MYCRFQADALNYLMENDGYKLSSHVLPRADLQKHMFIRDLAKGTKTLPLIGMSLSCKPFINKPMIILVVHALP